MKNKWKRFSLIQKTHKKKNDNGNLSNEFTEKIENDLESFDYESIIDDVSGEFSNIDDDSDELEIVFDDNSFDFSDFPKGYDYDNNGTCYDPEPYFQEPFYEFQLELDDLHRYFHLVKHYLNKHKDEVREDMEKFKDEDYYDAIVMEYDSCDDLTKMHYEGIVISLYKIFEKTLMRFIEQENSENDSAMSFYEDDYIVPKYMHYLHYNLGIFIPKNMYNTFNWFRLVRNYIVHGSDKARSKLEEYLERDTTGIYSDGELNITSDYLEYMIETVSNIVKCIEIASLKNGGFPEYQKY